MANFNSYVKLPEGTPKCFSFSFGKWWQAPWNVGLWRLQTKPGDLGKLGHGKQVKAPNDPELAGHDENHPSMQLRSHFLMVESSWILISDGEIQMFDA